MANDKLSSIVILAGGLATRLRPKTLKIPKSMLEVAGEPFISHQLKLLKKNGIDNCVLCVGFLSEQIKDYIGDGSSLNIKVRYSDDGEKLLKTGGAIKKALPLLSNEFFVLYGDSYLDIDYQAVYKAYKNSGKPALMTVYKNEGNFDSSNIIFENGVINKYSKTDKSLQMKYIDYGLAILNKKVFDTVPQNQPYDLAQLYEILIDAGKMEGYEITKRFYEIGSEQGIKETEQYIKHKE